MHFFKELLGVVSHIFYFHPYLGNDPISLIFFKWVETTKWLCIFPKSETFSAFFFTYYPETWRLPAIPTWKKANIADRLQIRRFTWPLSHSNVANQEGEAERWLTSVGDLGGSFKYFFIFTPTWGRFPSSTHIFERGWFNHQPGMCSTEIGHLFFSIRIKTAEVSSN